MAADIWHLCSEFGQARYGVPGCGQIAAEFGKRLPCLF